ncbi:MAG: hypothetical protein ACRYGM_24155 [Janthinobacterium lividum]
MGLRRASASSATAARDRLLSDKALQPLIEQRAQLAILAERLNRAGRGALTLHLSERVRQDARYAPLLRRLIQMTLQA